MALNTLIFVDTNILLDLYRVRSGGDANLELLRHLETNQEKLIVTDQVEMEFKRNRQQIVKAAIDNLKPIQAASYPIPSFLTESQPGKMLDKNRADFNEQQAKLKARLERALAHPAQHDPVYQIAQRIFTSDSACRLGRENEAKYEVWKKAERRFSMGYPPRKSADTSYGDAINWEWIVRSAIDKNARVVIVSRDSDYGVTHNSRPMLNAWLLQEFRERVGKTRKVVLTNRLAVAYREAGIPVTREESNQELSLIKERNERLRQEEPQILDLMEALRSSVAADKARRERSRREPIEE